MTINKTGLICKKDPKKWSVPGTGIMSSPQSPKSFRENWVCRAPLLSSSVFMSEMALSSLALKAISVANCNWVPLSTSKKCEWLRSIGLCLRWRGFSTLYWAGQQPYKHTNINCLLQILGLHDQQWVYKQLIAKEAVQEELYRATEIKSSKAISDLVGTCMYGNNNSAISQSLFTIFVNEKLRYEGKSMFFNQF